MPGGERYFDRDIVLNAASGGREMYMKRLTLISMAALAFAALTSSVSAMPLAPANTLTSDSSESVVLVRGGHGHGHGFGHVRRGGRGHHYGWARSRGHHHGFSRGRHRGW
jgi:hypothetical protein